MNAMSQVFLPGDSGSIWSGSEPRKACETVVSRKLTQSLAMSTSRSFVRPCVNPPLTKEFFSPPGRKAFSGEVCPKSLRALAAFKSFFPEGVFMNELMRECKTDAMETLRLKSRFDEFSEVQYYENTPYHFHSHLASNDTKMSIDITCESMAYGIKKPVVVPEKLYHDWINQGSCLTLQRIGVLCHAFLYAVDLDQHNTRLLEFPVPFFTQGIGYTPVKVKAELIDGRNKQLYFDLA
jgi:hypothetical protein